MTLHRVRGQPLRTPVQRAVGFILIALLLHSGCATYQPPATVSEAERNACEEFAKATAASVEGYLTLSRNDVDAIGYSFGLLLPFVIAEKLVRNAKARQQAYEYALKQCVGRALAALADVAAVASHRLRNLANGYADQGKFAEAEPLYKRALEIQEKALAAGYSSEAAIMESAALLEDYAALLRKTNRDAEAEEMEARAKAIRPTGDPGY